MHSSYGDASGNTSRRPSRAAVPLSRSPEQRLFSLCRPRLRNASLQRRRLPRALRLRTGTNLPGKGAKRGAIESPEQLPVGRAQLFPHRSSAMVAVRRSWPPREKHPHEGALPNVLQPLAGSHPGGTGARQCRCKQVRQYCECTVRKKRTDRWASSRTGSNRWLRSEAWNLFCSGPNGCSPVQQLIPSLQGFERGTAGAQPAMSTAESKRHRVGVAAAATHRARTVQRCHHAVTTEDPTAYGRVFEGERPVLSTSLSIAIETGRALQQQPHQRRDLLMSQLDCPGQRAARSSAPVAPVYNDQGLELYD